MRMRSPPTSASPCCRNSGTPPDAARLASHHLRLDTLASFISAMLPQEYDPQYHPPQSDNSHPQCVLGDAARQAGSVFCMALKGKREEALGS